MAVRVSRGDQYLFVSNARMGSLVGLGLEVAEQLMETAEERAATAALRTADEEGRWTWDDFAIERVFPDLAVRAFFARVFEELAQRMYLREIGDHTSRQDWQASFIGDACWLARMCRDAAIRDAPVSPPPP